MPQVLEELRADHANLAKLLILLDEEVRRLMEPEASGFRTMYDIMDYMLNYPTLCHHPKEDLVFKKLLQRDPGSGGVVDELLRAHEELEASTKELANALSRVAAGSGPDKDRVLALARDYLAELRHHMAREDETVFLLAENRLTEDDWAEVDATISMDDPLFGGKVQPVYVALRERLIARSGESG
jgi:hemerythrin-like domain-containing protein